MTTREAWIYPIGWCPTCKAGFSTVEDLIDHQLRKRHWKPILPPATVVDPAGAAKLKTALAARQQAQQEGHDDPRAV
jgi:hypothetical protein